MCESFPGVRHRSASGAAALSSPGIFDSLRRRAEAVASALPGRTPALLTLFLFPALLPAQDWPSYGGDPGGSKYSELRQINRDNVTRLEVAWTYSTGELESIDSDLVRRQWTFEATPLAVDGILYLVTPLNRLIALDGETGKEIWRFDPQLALERPTNLFANRGAAYWRGGQDEKIFFGTLDGRLFAVDRHRGKPVESFGEGGFVDLKKGMVEGFERARYGMTSPPAVFRDLVITGAQVPDGEPQGPSGDVRAFDARTGKLVWRFHTVPRPGEFGQETWQGDSWKRRGGVNVWSVMSVDEENGLVFLPLTSPAYDYYGGDRKGANLFGDSLVALEAATGKRRWHFQTIHHNLWDYDLPAQPNLITLERDGEKISAVAQVTKTGFVFLFDRLSGKPLFEIQERRAPKGKIAGEQYWPTQPFPSRPPPFARQTMRRDELTDVTPESRAECEKLAEGAVLNPLYGPFSDKYHVMFPGTNGGANWGGASFDPETGVLYANSMDVGTIARMVERPEGSLVPFRRRGKGTRNSRFWDSNLYPCQKPPWGHLTAIDLVGGEIKWRAVLGEYDELTRRGVPKTGASNLGGSIVTAGGLLFIGATNDSRFRAFDKSTGNELWAVRIPASGHATPITYTGKKSGRQFVVIAAGGGNKYNTDISDMLVAFALP